jgi:hypothetical protein
MRRFFFSLAALAFLAYSIGSAAVSTVVDARTARAAMID